MIVLLLIADSLRADGPGYAGGENTPFLDDLAARGVTARDAFAAGAWTVPSLMSMLTGSLGHRVGVCRWRHPFPAGRPNLFTAFRAAGFETRCFHPYPRWGFLTVPGKERVENSQDPDAIRAALRGERGRDRFVLVHHWWTHLPYITRELPRKTWHAACDFAVESLGRYPDRIAATLEASYRKTVSHFSREIVPTYLDAAAEGGEDVLLVLTGDHGENWGSAFASGHNAQHIFDLHGRWIADETVRVPLLIHGKTAAGAIPGGRILDGFVSGADLPATICELAGVPWPGPAPSDLNGMATREGGDAELNIIGRSFATCVRDGTPTNREEIWTVSSHNTHVPDTYPDDGRLMWRTMALRRREGWYVLDGIDHARAFKPADPGHAPNAPGVDRVFTRLAGEHLRAVDSAPVVDFDTADELRDPALAVGRRLKSLGYLE